MVQVKANFKNGLDNIICDLCNIEEDDQCHLLSCEKLMYECEDLYNDDTVEYEDIFSNTENQLKAVKLFQKVLKVRENLLLK